MAGTDRLGVWLGYRADIWLTHEKQIGLQIEKHNLTPVSRRAVALPETGNARNVININEIDGIDGGMKVPHFHYRGELYLLEPNQWREFSGAVLKDLSKRLADSETVSFHEVLDISNAVGSVMR